jgi:hypothetical protein
VFNLKFASFTDHSAFKYQHVPSAYTVPFFYFFLVDGLLATFKPVAGLALEMIITFIVFRGFMLTADAVTTISFIPLNDSIARKTFSVS